MRMSENLNHFLKFKLLPASSKFTVQAFPNGILAGFGHSPTIGIRDFTGVGQFVPETFTNAEFQMIVKTSSLTVLDDIKEKDRREIERLMQDEVLHAATFPEVHFQSTSITVTRILPGRYKARIIGDLTLHGVKRQGLWILAQVTLVGETLRAQGDFTLRQTDYGIKLVSIAAGALRLKDELKFVFDLVGEPEGNNTNLG